LDARSRDKFDLLHVQGAINLPFADISEPSLAKTLPDKNQIILIYCNNNFEKAPVAFETKRAGASLNISTFIALHTYGYRQVYELGPLLDVHTTKIPLVGERR
jgi:rhodanese-related sulfurtransferase